MKFAVFALFEEPGVNSPKTVFSKVLEQAEAAEGLGYEGIWLAEHHFTSYGILASPAVIGAAIAERTRRLRIGTAVSILPFHDPRRIAEDYAILDVLSDGRVDFGVGRGYQPAEFASFGISMDESRARFNEALAIIEGLWTTDNFSYDGEFWQVDDLTLYAKPIQQPTPPIWLAAVSPDSFQLAAKAGRQILTAPQITPLSKVREGYVAYREAAQEAGYDVTNLTLPMQRMVYVSDDADAAIREPAEHVMWYQERNAARMATSKSDAKDYDFYKKAQNNLANVEYDEMVRSGALLFGTPDDAIRQIKMLREEVDLNYLICWMNVGGLDQELVLKSMEIFARDVMPEFTD